MFAELMPLLADRTVVLTLAKTGDTQLAVSVIPKRSGEKDENSALCTPLTLTGTPDELDHELAGVLRDYVDTLGKFRHSLADVKTATEEAVKTAEAEGKKKIDDAKKAANLKTSRSAMIGKASDPPAAPRAELFAGSMPPAAPEPAPLPAAPPATAEPAPIRRRTVAGPKPTPAPPAPEPELESVLTGGSGLDPDPEPPPVPDGPAEVDEADPFPF
jgi:PRTRC genetic system protein E